MAEIVLFHHVQGHTHGVEALGEALRAGGHTVHVPDLFEGRTFASVEDGQAYRESLGEDYDARAAAVVDALPADVVYAGISLGVVTAQQYAQSRAGARGALLIASFVAPHFLGRWPVGLPAQIHGKDDDPFFAHEGDLEAARELVAATPSVELFTYPGAEHLFVDGSLPDYDAEATSLVVRRALEFLERV